MLMLPADWDQLTDEEYRQLPLVVEGESKIVRDAGEGLALVRFKPTIYSHTQNRAGVVPGSDALRMRATRVFVDLLHRAGIAHSYRQVGQRYILADLIHHPPPIEVVIKAFHSGTSKHRYFGMAGSPLRPSHPFWKGVRFAEDDGYPAPIVRFDWRNPMRHPGTGERLADEVLCDEQADWFIDTREARGTARRVFKAISDFLAERDIVMYDLCLFVTEDGKTVFGEISQDCGRFRHFDLGSLDKDVWRSGGSSEIVLEKWKLLLDILGRVVTR
jgi:phosphoribosylaminoimidazole-succinocarboxamide synthase